MHRVPLVFLALALQSTSTFAFADLIAPIVFVLDGDTIEVLHNQHPERIRLHGIDYPEKR